MPPEDAVEHGMPAVAMWRQQIDIFTELTGTAVSLAATIGVV